MGDKFSVRDEPPYHTGWVEGVTSSHPQVPFRCALCAHCVEDGTKGLQPLPVCLLGTQGASAFCADPPPYCVQTPGVLEIN